MNSSSRLKEFLAFYRFQLFAVIEGAVAEVVNVLGDNDIRHRALLERTVSYLFHEFDELLYKHLRSKKQFENAD